MKTENRKLAFLARWGFYTLFGTLGIIALVAILLGYYLQIATALGCGAMVYTIMKYW